MNINLQLEMRVGPGGPPCKDLCLSFYLFFALSGVLNDTLGPHVMDNNRCFSPTLILPFPLQIMRLLTLRFLPCGMRAMQEQEELISRLCQPPSPPTHPDSEKRRIMRVLEWPLAHSGQGRDYQ